MFLCTDEVDKEEANLAVQNEAGDVLDQSRDHCVVVVALHALSKLLQNRCQRMFAFYAHSVFRDPCNLQRRAVVLSRWESKWSAVAIVVQSAFNGTCSAMGPGRRF